MVKEVRVNRVSIEYATVEAITIILVPFLNQVTSARWKIGHWLVLIMHDDVIKCKHFPRYWPFVWGIHRSPVNSPHKGQWRGAFMFSLICTRINGWLNNGEAGDLRRHRAHFDVTVMVREMDPCVPWGPCLPWAARRSKSPTKSTVVSTARPSSCEHQSSALPALWFEIYRWPMDNLLKRLVMPNTFFMSWCLPRPNLWIPFCNNKIIFFINSEWQVDEFFAHGRSVPW